MYIIIFIYMCATYNEIDRIFLYKNIGICDLFYFYGYYTLIFTLLYRNINI